MTITLDAVPKNAHGWGMGNYYIITSCGLIEITDFMARTVALMVLYFLSENVSAVLITTPSLHVKRFQVVDLTSTVLYQNVMHPAQVIVSLDVILSSTTVMHQMLQAHTCT